MPRRSIRAPDSQYRPDAANGLRSSLINSTSNTGTLVSALLASGAEGNPIYDPDSLAKQGIAVTQVDNTNGAWQYSTNGGTTWTAFGAVTETSSVLLASDTLTRIRFVPNTNFSGDVPGGITFRAWDQTSGTNGGTADTSTNGGSTAFSSAILSADIRVSPASSDPWQNPAECRRRQRRWQWSARSRRIGDHQRDQIRRLSHAPTRLRPATEPPPYYDLSTATARRSRRSMRST